MAGERAADADTPRRGEVAVLLVIVSWGLAFVLLRWAASVDTPVYPGIARKGSGTFLVVGLLASVPALVAAVLGRRCVGALAVVTVVGILGFAAFAEWVVGSGGIHLTS
jgi:hypothetical protein